MQDMQWLIAQENNKRLKERIENAEYDFSGFSTKKSDKESKSAVCQAELSIISGDKVESKIVEYSVRYSDDKSKIYVDFGAYNFKIGNKLHFADSLWNRRNV